MQNNVSAVFHLSVGVRPIGNKLLGFHPRLSPGVCFYMLSRKTDNLKIHLIYNPSPETNFRLFKAFSVLISEKEVLDYFNNPKNFKNKCQRKKK